MDFTMFVALAAAVLGAVSTLLHFVAPRTDTKIDDTIEAVVDQVLAYLGQHDPSTGVPKEVEPEMTKAVPVAQTYPK